MTRTRNVFGALRSAGSRMGEKRFQTKSRSLRKIDRRATIFSKIPRFVWCLRPGGRPLCGGGRPLPKRFSEFFFFFFFFFSSLAATRSNFGCLQRGREYRPLSPKRTVAYPYRHIFEASDPSARSLGEGAFSMTEHTRFPRSPAGNWAAQLSFIIKAAPATLTGVW